MSLLIDGRGPLLVVNLLTPSFYPCRGAARLGSTAIQRAARARRRRMPEATLMAQLSSFAARTHVGFAWKFVWLSRFQRDNVRAIIELVYTLDTANHMACRKVKPSLHYRVVVVLVLGRSLCEVALQAFY